MAFTLNGFGTKYYGLRELPDGTCITTKWIVLMFVPILPINSVRIVDGCRPGGPFPTGGRSFSGHEVALDKEMILRTYIWVLAAILALVVLAVFGKQ